MAFLPLLLSCLLLQDARAGSEPEPIAEDVILWHRNYDSPAIRAMLRLALDKTPEYGGARIVRSAEMNQGRALRELSKNRTGNLSVANVASSPKREDDYLSVPIPLTGGLLGYRVCLIRPGDQARFNSIRNLGDLRKSDIRFGQGKHWPDTRILEANGFPVITSSQFPLLFRMLANGRFDCFARGVSEVFFDLKRSGIPDLEIENSLLLTYDMPSFFFLGKESQELAHRIQLGLERAIMDGTFALYFERYFASALRKLELSDRRVLHLGNPWVTHEEWPPVTRDLMQQTRERIQLH